MIALVAILLLAQAEPTPDAQAPAAQAPEASSDRWDAARTALDPAQHAGLEYLLAHMPEADRAGLDVHLVVENIDYAYRARQAAPWGAALPDEVFLDAVLPYASINERRDRWRKDFFERLAPLVAAARTPSEAAAILNNRIWELFGVKYSTARPKADQSPYESIEAGLASCTGLTVLLIDACRAVGVPARFVGTPLWADGSGNHSWVEVWDDGWHYTGAAEPTGDVLDRGWFADRAAQAVAGDPMRAIFATSWRRTPKHFPMVWKPGATDVPAVEVTARYTERRAVAEGMARLRVEVRDASGTRVARQVTVRERDADTVLYAGTSHDGGFDGNDLLTAVLPLGTRLTVEVEGREDAPMDFVLDADDTRVRFTREGASWMVTVQPPRAWLWAQHVERVRRERAAEMQAKLLRIGELEMRFDYRVFGDAPAGGRSLWISMHGGGGAPAAVNDQQWENQKGLYKPAEGVYLAPRAPTNTWNLWHEGHIDRFFDRLIEDLVVFEGVDPDRVYLMGYSAGGDGVYQLAPRMADRFAAAAMMAGHPNETQPDGLRNLPFTLHMGAEDGAYDRNRIAGEWQEKLAALEAADPGGYPHWVEIHAGKGHWMDRQDAAALPWMAKFTRERRPQRIVWLQDDVLHDRYYWLKVDAPVARSRVVVEREGQVFRIVEAGGYPSLTLRMDEQMVDFGEDVVVVGPDGAELFRGRVAADLEVLRRTLAERGTEAGMWPAELRVALQ